MKCHTAFPVSHSSICFASACPSFTLQAVLLPSISHLPIWHSACPFTSPRLLFLFLLSLIHSSQEIWKNYSIKDLHKAETSSFSAALFEKKRTKYVLTWRKVGIPQVPLLDTVLTGCSYLISESSICQRGRKSGRFGGCFFGTFPQWWVTLISVNSQGLWTPSIHHQQQHLRLGKGFSWKRRRGWGEDVFYKRINSIAYSPLSTHLLQGWGLLLEYYCHPDELESW